MDLSIADGVSWLEKRIPLDGAAEWDNTGLLLGDPQRPLRKIGTCLTVTPSTTQQACALGIDLLISHHPILFRGSKSLVATRPQDRMILDLVRAGVAVFSPHTAWDNASGGINDQLAQKAGIVQARALRSIPKSANQVKLVVFVPLEARERLAKALFEAGAGIIGAYQGCSFRIPGTGTFFGTETTNPAVGKKGQTEEVAEERLELVCPKTALERAILALKANHPYEEPAFDIYPLVEGTATTRGEGRIGERSEPVTLDSLAGELAASVGAKSTWVVGDRQQSIKRVAIVCGSGGDFLSDAIRQRADAFVTGEMTYHQALLAQAQGIGLIVLGHHASEHFAMAVLGQEMALALPGVSAHALSVESDPFQAL